MLQDRRQGWGGNGGRRPQKLATAKTHLQPLRPASLVLRPPKPTSEGGSPANLYNSIQSNYSLGGGRGWKSKPSLWI